MKCPIMLKISAGVSSMPKIKAIGMKAINIKPIKPLAKTSPNKIQGFTRNFKVPTMRSSISPSISKAYPMSIDDSLARRRY